MRIFKYITTVAILLAPLSCQKNSPQPETGGKPLRLSVVTSSFTKGSEFTAADPVDEHSKILLTMTQRDAEGIISRPSMFMSGDAPTTAQLKKEGSSWVVKDHDIVLPPGDNTLDILAFGTCSDKGLDVSAFGVSTWVPVLNTANAAGSVSFTQNTYGNQMDLLYASCNGISAQSFGGTLQMQHAQALLVFNVKFDAGSAAVAFIEDNGTNYKFKIDDILFLDNDGYTAYNADPASVPAGNILLKTRGTFSIDNTKVALEAGWSSLSAVAGAYSLPMNPGGRSAVNTAAHASCYFKNTDSDTDWRRDITRGTIYQVGDTLLVPEQDVTPFIVRYTYEGNHYKINVNPPSGRWLAGHTYIYTLTFSNVGI